ncbi:hypothetical protein [Salinithrix halophila]
MFVLTAKVLSKKEGVPVEGQKVLCRAVKGADGDTYWVVEKNRLKANSADSSVILIDPVDFLSDDGRKLARVSYWPEEEKAD